LWQAAVHPLLAKSGMLPIGQTNITLMLGDCDSKAFALAKGALFPDQD
jgi:hypothetical protein